jgi:hypothetical protein
MYVDADSPGAALELFLDNCYYDLVGDVQFSITGKGVWIDGSQFVERDSDGDLQG